MMEGRWMKGIEWATKAWNPIRGCTARCWASAEHTDGNCYAACMARRRMTKCVRCHEHLDVHFHAERLDQPKHWGGTETVFLGSMTDLWDPHVDPEWRRQIWDVVRSCGHHQFRVFTKRPDRIDYMEVIDMPHLIVGVSIPDPDYTSLAEDLRAVRSRWIEAGANGPTTAISFEPLIVPPSSTAEHWAGKLAQCVEGTDWVILGAPTGAVARMYPQDQRRLKVVANWIADAARERGIPLFTKLNLLHLMRGQGPKACRQWWSRWPVGAYD